MKIFKIKEGKLEQWKQWCKELETSRRGEAIETLRDEGVTREGCLLFQIGTDNYVVGFAEGNPHPSDPTLSINQEHKRHREECLESVVSTQVLYDLRLEDE
ncbi:MAG TPA: DUF6176 family protein [Candidatus Paceibacterota bacterium]|nr:DUF6176 family protein [Candidatus Paceibacterota bacterium]